MANEKRLIDANAINEKCRATKLIEVFPEWKDMPLCAKKAVVRTGAYIKKIVQEAPTVDAVPVDEIRVDIMSLSLENQEAVLNVSIYGKPNEVKIPFSKEVAEVVHGHWIFKNNPITDPKGYFIRIVCSRCTLHTGQKSNYCPQCGAKMDGDGNG